MNKFFRYENYSSHSNKEIDALENELEKIRKRDKEIEGKMEEIHSNCDHEYLFISQGMYEDAYRCRKCGHDEDH